MPVAAEDQCSATLTRRSAFVSTSLVIAIAWLVPAGRAAALDAGPLQVGAFQDPSPALTSHWVFAAPDFNPARDVSQARLANRPRRDRGLEPLLAGATDVGLRDPALAVAATRYPGSVRIETVAHVVVQADALMCRAIADAGSVPTCCGVVRARGRRPYPPSPARRPRELDRGTELFSRR